MCTSWITFHVLQNHVYHTESDYLQSSLSHRVTLSHHVHIINYFSLCTESRLSHRVRLSTVRFITHRMNYFSRSTQWRLSHRESGLSHTVWIAFHVLHSHNCHTESGYPESGLSHTLWITFDVLHSHVCHTESGYHIMYTSLITFHVPPNDDTLQTCTFL